MLQAQLAAKRAALTELDVLADAAGAAAAQNSALSTELADKARAIAEQDRKLAAMRDQVPLSNIPTVAVVLDQVPHAVLHTCVT